MDLPSDAYFHDEAAAFAALEEILWPGGPVCPHCGQSRRIYPLRGKTTRIGLRKCGACRKQFTVKVGTAFESSHLPLHKYLLGLYLFTTRRGETGARELQQALGVTYKSAWNLHARLHAAQRAGHLPAVDEDGRVPIGKLGPLRRVCDVYNRHFRLTLHTRNRHNSLGSTTSRKPRTPTPQAAGNEAPLAAKSEKAWSAGRVRKQRVLATATAIDIAEEDHARAHVYALVGALLSQAPSGALLARLVALKGDGSPLGQALMTLAQTARGIGPAEAGDEYNALFIGMPQGELVPYASYYLTGFLHEKPLARLRGDMAELGIAREDGVAEPEDHVASVCEMMAGLITGHFGAPAALDAQRRFFDAHLGCWAPRFFDDLQAAKSARLYMPVGRIGRLFMDIERDSFAMAA